MPALCQDKDWAEKGRDCRIHSGCNRDTIHKRFSLKDRIAGRLDLQKKERGGILSLLFLPENLWGSAWKGSGVFD